MTCRRSTGGYHATDRLPKTLGRTSLRYRRMKRAAPAPAFRPAPQPSIGVQTPGCVRLGYQIVALRLQTLRRSPSLTCRRQVKLDAVPLPVMPRAAMSSKAELCRALGPGQFGRSSRHSGDDQGGDQGVRSTMTSPSTCGKKRKDTGWMAERPASASTMILFRGAAPSPGVSQAPGLAISYGHPRRCPPVARRFSERSESPVATSSERPADLQAAQATFQRTTYDPATADLTQGPQRGISASRPRYQG